MSKLPKSAFVSDADYVQHESVVVNGIKYPVTRRSGYLKAAMNNYYGWTSVWADTEVNLVRRVKQVRSGGQ